MKYAKLLIGLVAVCGITVVNAAEVQGTSCGLGESCYFQSNGSIVHFAVENLDKEHATLVNCKLVGDQTDGAHAATALAYPGKDADFTRATVGFNKPVSLSIYSVKKPEYNGSGEIKLRLKADRTYPADTIGVTCRAVNSEVAV